MVPDDADPARETTTSEAISGPTSAGDAARMLVALIGIVLGVVWTVRIAMDGALATGVLFRLLPPLALIYLGVRYFRSVVTADQSDEEQ